MDFHQPRGALEKWRKAAFSCCDWIVAASELPHKLSLRRIVERIYARWMEWKICLSIFWGNSLGSWPGWGISRAKLTDYQKSISSLGRWYKVSQRGHKRLEFVQENALIAIYRPFCNKERFPDGQSIRYFGFACGGSWGVCLRRGLG